MSQKPKSKVLSRTFLTFLYFTMTVYVPITTYEQENGYLLPCELVPGHTFQDIFPIDRHLLYLDKDITFIPGYSAQY